MRELIRTAFCRRMDRQIRSLALACASINTVGSESVKTENRASPKLGNISALPGDAPAKLFSAAKIF